MSKSIEQTANLFIPFPDGNAIMYDLKGISLEPLVEKSLKFNVDCKITNVLKVNIKNWSINKQCFNVSWRFNNNDTSVVIKGGSAIDLTGKEEKEYKLNFLCFNEGVYKFTLTFTNIINQEYQFYDIEVTAKKKDIIEYIELKGPIREIVSKNITIENPTTEIVKFDANNHKMPLNHLIWLNPDSFTIQPGKSIGIQVNYRPLLEQKFEDKFSLVSNQLGEFTYALKLTGITNDNIRTVLFKSEIGYSNISPIKLQSYLTKQINYQIKINN